jgi:acetyl-CoA carboxylase biotin carboxyl carrier protein
MRTDKVKKIIKLLEENNLEELEIKGLFGSVRVAKRLRQQSAQPPVAESHTQEPESEKGVHIKAPMVGTFYRSSSPKVPAYMEVGDKVIPGKVVCIIEAMKVMNEIESDVGGIVREVLVKNEEPVEYGQPLFRVEPE